MAEHRITKVTPQDSLGSLVFWRQRSLRSIEWGHPHWQMG